MDRNILGGAAAKKAAFKSLSARRAWIEIVFWPPLSIPSFSSLSARRAWIEILCCVRFFRQAPVALRKESVDRNNLVACLFRFVVRRSPQGERG